MKEYIQALKAIWRCWRFGDDLKFEGQHYQFTLMPPYFNPESLGLRLPPVTLAAVGPAMLRVAGEVADGARLHPFCTPKYLSETVLPELKKGMERGGRSRETFEITGGGFIATGPNDAKVHEIREWIRYRVGFYGSTPAYYPVLEAHDLKDLGLKLNRMTKDGEWDKLQEVISDDVLELFAISGRHDEIKSVIEKRLGSMTDTVYASANSALPSDLPPELIQDLNKIDTPFKGFYS
jgi:probable F420-dependent oxidoreductase